MIRNLLAHPLTRGLGVDDPRTTSLRLQIVREKRFLNNIYRDWYATLKSAVPAGSGHVVEIGSGAGFFKEVMPEAITTEVFATPGVDMVMDATAMPFDDHSVRAIVMTDVLHHIPDVAKFLTEASRVLQPGGVIAMIEPWVTPWSSLVYSKMHSEPFLPASPQWEFPASGPLSGANGALPWMVFVRDEARFKRDYPTLEVLSISPMMPIRYLVSGGISMRSLLPGWSYPLVAGIERLFSALLPQTAMFAAIVVQKCSTKAI